MNRNDLYIFEPYATNDKKLAGLLTEAHALLDEIETYSKAASRNALAQARAKDAEAIRTARRDGKNIPKATHLTAAEDTRRQAEAILPDLRTDERQLDRKLNDHVRKHADKYLTAYDKQLDGYQAQVLDHVKQALGYAMEHHRLASERHHLGRALNHEVGSRSLNLGIKTFGTPALESVRTTEWLAKIAKVLDPDTDIKPNLVPLD